ncbi:ABC transporter substrate-binding protein [Microbacterium sp.]|uniref:ABC transporter substrate-binding protein n=1 Tax=Microbacterium sp. TaxID=51671 RepID=UPI003F7016C3
MRRSRRLAVPLAIAAVVGLTACAPALPASVVPGSTITVGWTQELTSTNAIGAPTPWNLEIAAATRSGFGEVVAGEFVPDPGFGTVTIEDDDPFTVRYDLAEPSWSDGIPLDAADLLLGWAAASGLLDPAGDVDAEEADPVIPEVDEFARAIQVTYPRPVDDWQQRIGVAVPAHVVARGAFGVEDPMEAKQALITAILENDTAALGSVAEFWNDGFALPDEGAIPADLLLSSGPFRVDAVTRDADGQSVALVPNADYRGTVTPKVAEIALVPAGDDPLSALGDRLDIVSLAPVAADRDPIQALERRDFTSGASHDGTLWALQLNPAGVFARPEARAAFLRAIPANDVVERGGGAWASVYAPTTSPLSAPGTRAYDIATSDAGFSAALTGADDPASERAAAGVAAGAPVCVLFDRADEFATGAFAAVQAAAQEAGWNAVDCAADDLDGALTQGGWDAVISRIPLPQTAADISVRWGSGPQASGLSYADPARDELIAQLAQTTDVYAARDLRAQIEASIVSAAAVLPIAMNPRVTVVDKDVIGVASRDGAVAPLLSGAVQWAVVP